MYDRLKLLKISDDLLNSIKVSEEALNSLILSANQAGYNLNRHFSSPENDTLQQITDLIDSMVTAAEDQKNPLLKMRNTIEKLKVYLKYPSLNYYWV